jgi:3-oxoacyl-[acyl-carrier protein] reductase
MLFRLSASAPADIAEAVAFLSSRARHWINGQTIRVNGGIS